MLGGVAVFDYNRDGRPDLFFTNGANLETLQKDAAKFRNRLFRNDGNGVFTDVTEKAGVAGRGYDGGVAVGDFDNDGYPDLFVAGVHHNTLYHNNRDGTFSDVTVRAGIANAPDAQFGPMWGVAAAWVDVNNDGLLDLFVTNFDGEHNTLYENLGAKGFLDESLPSKLGSPSVPYVGWGTGLVDFDNDGLLDVFVANGHVYPQLELVKSDKQMGFRQDFLLHRNLGNEAFEEISGAAGLRHLPLRSRRGAAFGDLNNDGLVDVVVTSLGELPTVLLNTTANPNRSVTLKLVQPKYNRNAIGSRATLVTDKRSAIQEVEAGSSYLSQNDLRIHFGLTVDEKIRSLEIPWSGGTIEKVSGSTADRILTVQKGAGVIKTEEYRKR
jgi:hypothetical protein